jgi:hypothetical protein
MLPEYKELIADPTNKIKLIKFLRAVSGYDLQTTNPWADKALAINQEQADKALSNLNRFANIGDAKANLILVLKQLDPNVFNRELSSAGAINVANGTVAYAIIWINGWYYTTAKFIRD